MMEDQMKFAFMQQGGVLRDDGMNKDPVSGNEVPSGSMAKEVRDDIDANSAKVNMLYLLMLYAFMVWRSLKTYVIKRSKALVEWNKTVG